MGLMSCEKENNPETSDYRDIATGNYSGIRVDNYWIDTVVGFGHDTTGVVLTLTKSESDSVLEISFNPVYSNEEFSFRYEDGQFFPTTYYHPPVLSLVNDSLYFFHRPGLGPFWTECFTRKIE